MSKKSKNSSKNIDLEELSEDMEMVGPGQILSEARIQLSLSTEYVAEKLNFKKILVENIEQDLFDQNLPATFNRGYLRSYAKLVNVDVDDVLSAYDMLDVAVVQRSEMQSFSNLTVKQAEHSRLMWFSYFIIAILVGLMVLWWQQEPKQTVDEGVIEGSSNNLNKTLNQDSQTKPKIETTGTSIVSSDKVESSLVKKATEQTEDKIEKKLPPAETNKLTSTVTNNEQSEIEEVSKSLAVIIEDVPDAEINESEVDISTVVFSFSGDCWVNIYDATGERVAWGVKKSGYVMTIKGQAPLNITLGRPELASIVFNGQLVDLSMFSPGNIAKFTLPINS